MLAELDNGFAARQVVNFPPVLSFFRRRLAAESDAQRAAEAVFRFALEPDGTADSCELLVQLRHARSLLLNDSAGPRRAAFGASAAAVALTSLPDRDREALMLAHWDELQVSEISSLLDQNRLRVQCRLRLARRAYAAARTGGSKAAGFVVGRGIPTFSELEAIDPAASRGAYTMAANILLGWRTLKKIADSAATFTDEPHSGAGGRATPVGVHRSAWPVLAMAETAALLVLGVSDLRSVWPPDGQEQSSRGAAGYSSGPATLWMPAPVTLRSGAAAQHGGARPSSDGIPASGCSLESVATIGTELLRVAGQPMRPWDFSLLGCAEGWMAFVLSVEGERTLTAPGPESTIFLAKRQETGYVFDATKPYALMPSWQSLSKRSISGSEGRTAAQEMDDEFTIRGVPAQLRGLLIGRGP